MGQRNVLTSPRRLVIRLGLAAGATISALLGAQALAFLEHAPATNPAVPGKPGSTQQATLQAAKPGSTVSTAAPLSADAFKVRRGVTKPNSAPLVIIVRNPVRVQQAGTTKAVRSNIVPPAPELVAPEPAVVQSDSGSQGGGSSGAVQPAPQQPAPSTASSGGK